MTNEEAVTFLNSITPEPVHMMTIDPAQWDDFKTSMVDILTSTATNTDPKYRQALEDINNIVDTTLT